MIKEVNAFIYAFLGWEGKYYLHLYIFFPIQQSTGNFHMYVKFFKYDVTPQKTQYHYYSMAQEMPNFYC